MPRGARWRTGTAMSFLVTFVLVLGGACRKPPDLRELCKRICSCGCDVDECIQREAKRRDAYRTSENCSREVDELTECEIEHGYCDKTLTGLINYQAPVCGQLVGSVMSCKKQAP